MIKTLTKETVKETAENAAKIIKEGGVAVIPTDTIYGIVCDAFNKKAVERIYEIKSREKNKPFLVLLSSINEISRFSDKELPSKVLKQIPAALTFILPLKQGVSFSFTKNTLAMRIPAKENEKNIKLNFLYELLKEAKTIVAPSANPANTPPNMKIDEIIDLYENKVDLIVNAGDVVDAKASTIYDVINDKILREGSVRID